MKFFLHRGLSFCDVSVVDDTGQDCGSARWLYSKHRFRSQIESFLKDWATQIKEVILLDEFADRMSGLRLGGSVAAVFPKGLEKLTQKTQSSPIHSESMVFTEPESWNDEWVEQTLATIQKETTKRIAWQVKVPSDVLDRFATAGYENFVFEVLQSEMLPNWRRNLLNASCSGSILELTEEVQAIVQNLKIETDIKWVDEDLRVKSEVKNRYGLTSVWTHLISRWAQKKIKSPCDIFVLDWDGFFHIGPEQNQRWTPWGWIATHPPLPNVKLLKIQPTTTLEKNLFGAWSWIGRSDSYEPGPVFLGRGLKPTMLDVLIPRETLQNQFEVKSDFEERTLRLLSSLSGFKSSEQVQQFKEQISADVLLQWSQNMLEHSNTRNWILLGPLASEIKPEFQNLKDFKIQYNEKIPTLADLAPFLEKNL
jgi:hypothetical protein